MCSRLCLASFFLALLTSLQKNSYQLFFLVHPSPAPKINAEWDTFCIYFLSKPQVWYIITLQRVYNQLQRSWISSRPSRAYFFLRFDDIQHFVLVIYNFSEIGDIQGFRLDFHQLLTLKSMLNLWFSLDFLLLPQSSRTKKRLRIGYNSESFQLNPPASE